ncbi:MAG TPA: M48 family peptidase [Thermaerobacter sp.]
MNARVQGILNQIVRMFERGELPEAVARTYIRRAAGDLRPSDRWSLSNRLILLQADTEDARGIRQWNRVGRRVKKGAKAVYILGPVTRIQVVERRVEEIDPETGDARQITVRERRSVLVGFRAIPVFRREDTEPIPGKEVKEPDYRPAELPPLYEVAERLGVRVEWRPMEGKDYWGAYFPGRKRIELCTYDPHTFFHELAHVAHERVRGQLTGGQDPAQEIVAETVALALCKMYGYEGWEPHAYRYVAEYSRGKNPGRAVMALLAEIQRVLDLILGIDQQLRDGEDEGAEDGAA